MIQQLSPGSLERLLELSCDWYWILDKHWRVVQLGGRELDSGPSPMLAVLGKAPWEWPGVVVNAPDFEALSGALVRRHDLIDQQYTIRDRRGMLRYMAVQGEPIFDHVVAFSGYRGTLRDITQRKRAEALVALEHRVTRGLAEAATSRKVLQAVMRAICESEQWETAGFFRVEDSAGTTRLMVGWSGPGMADRAADYYQGATNKMIPSGGLLSRVALSGEPLWVDAMTESQTTWAQRIRLTGERATLFCPVRVDGAVTGIFAFASREIREPDAALLNSMRVIGEQVGQFLQRKDAQRVVKESEARFKALTQLSSDWYWETDNESRFTRIEGDQGESESTEPASKLIGKRRWETDFVTENAGGWSAHRAQIDERLPFRDLVLVRSLADGRKRYVSISGEPVDDSNGVFVGYRGIGQDITTRKLAENRIQHLATHDGLTGLPNRLLLSEQLCVAMRFARRNRRKIAVLFIDLDGFKGINDAWGHDAGDALLQVMAQRFRACLRGTDIVARLGGDEFVALLQELDGPEDVTAIAQKILTSASSPVDVLGRRQQVTASIGISMYDDYATDEQAMMRHADLAMYAAKSSGKNAVRFYVATDPRPEADSPI